MNLRTIKKDFLFVTNEFLSDCVTFSDYSAGKQDDKIQELINQALTLTDTSICKVNHRPSKGVRAYFKELCKNFYEGYDKLYEQLSGLAK